VIDDAYYRTRFPDTPSRRRLWPVLAAYLQRRFIPDDPVLLDLGAGYCYFANNVRAKEKHAVDVTEAVLSYAAPDVVAHVCSSAALDDLADSHFDVVFASNLLEHLDRETLAGTLREIRRVLRPGGRVIVIQPNFRLCFRRYFDDYTHVQVFTDRSLADMLSSYGLEPVEVVPRFLPFSVDSRLPAWPWLLALYLKLPYRPAAGQMLVVAERVPTAPDTSGGARGD
jgi:SAM-dependent methyltransferase